MCTDSSRMSPSSNDEGSSITINSPRLIGAFTFLAFVQSRPIRRNLYFLLRSMTLLIYLLICRKTSAADCLRKCMQFCVGCTAFAYVCVRILRVKRLLRTFVYIFCMLIVLCVRIRILHVKQSVHTDTAFCLR